MRLSFLLGGVGLAAAYFLDPAGAGWLAVALPLLALVFVAFDGLTIRVTRDEVAWRFGHLGFPRGHLALEQITSVEVTRTRFWDGWGIRRTQRGWLFNVSGYDAVILRRRDGKATLLGTDEPLRLKAAIEGELGRRRRTG